jgi:hypothetical protein
MFKYERRRPSCRSLPALATVCPVAAMQLQHHFLRIYVLNMSIRYLVAPLLNSISFTQSFPGTVDCS